MCRVSDDADNGCVVCSSLLYVFCCCFVLFFNQRVSDSYATELFQ